MALREHQPLDSRNSLRLPGMARALAEVRSDDELQLALDWARRRGLPVLPLGDGTNVVLAGDIDALVLRLASRGIACIARDDTSISLRVAAGENWHALVEWAMRQGYHGLENLALIPGAVGAAPVQNIGAYGVELREFLTAVHAVRCDDGSALTLDVSECEFGYRDSIFKHALVDRVIITAIDITLSLSAGCRIDYPALRDSLAEQGIAEPQPSDIFATVVAIRSSRLPDPRELPNAGSFFKNPVLSSDAAAALVERFPELPRYAQAGGLVKLPAAWMIEQCGWKGYRRGPVGVHGDHALVLVHYGGGNGAALLALGREIQASVFERFGVRLEMEPRIYGAGR